MMTKFDQMRRDVLRTLNTPDPESGPTLRRRVVFRKVYGGPGYPIDREAEEARKLDGYMNAFGPKQGKRTYDARPLKKWLAENIN